MVLPIFDDFPELIHKLHHLSIRPPQYPRVQSQHPPLQPIRPIPLPPPPQIFQLRILRPRPYRPHKSMLHYIHEPRLLHPRPHVPQRIEPHPRPRLPHAQYRLREIMIHLIRLGCPLRIGVRVHGELSVLEVASRL